VFKRPVAIGDTISLEVRPRGDAGRGLEAFEWRVTNQDGRLVLRAVVEAVVRGGEEHADDDLAAVPVTL
jgi:acyl dehydratase